MIICCHFPELKVWIRILKLSKTKAICGKRQGSCRSEAEHARDGGSIVRMALGSHSESVYSEKQSSKKSKAFVNIFEKQCVFDRFLRFVCLVFAVFGLHWSHLCLRLNHQPTMVGEPLCKSHLYKLHLYRIPDPSKHTLLISSLNDTLYDMTMSGCVSPWRLWLCSSILKGGRAHGLKRCVPQGWHIDFHTAWVFVCFCHQLRQNPSRSS